jgi:murein DD-endopeptidase MepM/ murein hydrolase activator NlpD
MLFGLAATGTGCGSEEVAGGESDAVTSQAVVGQQTFLYFRCNANGWNLDASTRLVSGSSPGTWTVAYDVAEAWMTTGWDTCTLLETNQFNGWGTQQTFYDKSGQQQLTVPSAARGSGQYVLARPGQDYHFNVRYPALGRYRMTVNWQDKSFWIERIDTPKPAGWLWPLAGQDGRAWVINNYVDLDPSSGVRDYRGGAKSYDGHLGTDIDIPSFREMDLGQAVHAISAGRVTATEASNPDRNTICQGAWNHVDVLTDDGYQVTYGHLRRNSVVVSVGSRVEVGATLAMVGSSGCSTWPHLHVEVVRAADGVLADPFRDGLWANPPVYDPPLTLLDTFVTDQEIVSTDIIANAPADAGALVRGGWIGIGINAAGGDQDDHLGITVTDAHGAIFQSVDFAMSGPVRHTLWYFNWVIGTDAPTGLWTVAVLVNGIVNETHTVQVH